MLKPLPARIAIAIATRARVGEDDEPDGGEDDECGEVADRQPPADPRGHDVVRPGREHGERAEHRVEQPARDGGEPPPAGDELAVDGGLRDGLAAARLSHLLRGTRTRHARGIPAIAGL
jgi:hypothetical protein